MAVADSVSAMSDAGDERFRRARAMVRKPEAFDVAAADHHISELLKATTA